MENEERTEAPEQDSALIQLMNPGLVLGYFGIFFGARLILALCTYYLGCVLVLSQQGSLGHGFLGFMAAAGTVSLAMSPIMTGTAITFVPYLILYIAINETFGEKKPLVAFVLQLALEVATLCASAMIGATIFGLAANPITLGMCCGALSVALIKMAVKLIEYGMSGKKEADTNQVVIEQNVTGKEEEYFLDVNLYSGLSY